MIIRKPSIFIYTCQADSRILKEICAGIEEEGVFFEVSEQEEEDVDALAWQAASDSMPGSGIGICRTSAAFQMKGLEKGRNVERCQNPAREQSRRLGANSARAVKKQAFKLKTARI